MARYINTPKTSLKGINSELVKIEDAFKDVLDRQGEDPNYMDTDLDMNSHRILNLPAPVHSQEPVRLGDVKPFIDASQTAMDAAIEAAEEAQASADASAASASESSGYVQDASDEADRAEAAADVGASYLRSVQSTADLRILKVDESLVGMRIRTKEYHVGTGYGGGEWEVVTGEVADNPLVIQSDYNPLIQFKIAEKDLNINHFGADGTLPGDSAAAQAVADYGMLEIVCPFRGVDYYIEGVNSLGNNSLSIRGVSSGNNEKPTLRAGNTILNVGANEGAKIDDWLLFTGFRIVVTDDVIDGLFNFGSCRNFEFDESVYIDSEDDKYIGTVIKGSRTYQFKFSAKVFVKGISMCEIGDTVGGEVLDSINLSDCQYNGNVGFIQRAGIFAFHNIQLDNSKFREKFKSPEADLDNCGETNLSSSVTAGDTVMTVDDATQLRQGLLAADDLLYVGIQNTAEVVRIASVSGNTITLDSSTPFRFDHGSDVDGSGFGEPVIFGPVFITVSDGCRALTATMVHFERAWAAIHASTPLTSNLKAVFTTSRHLMMLPKSGRGNVIGTISGGNAGWSVPVNLYYRPNFASPVAGVEPWSVGELPEIEASFTTQIDNSSNTLKLWDFIPKNTVEIPRDFTETFIPARSSREVTVNLDGSITSIKLQTGLYIGQECTVIIRQDSTGKRIVFGFDSVCTLKSDFKASLNPNTSKVISFRWDGTNWIEFYRSYGEDSNPLPSFTTAELSDSSNNANVQYKYNKLLILNSTDGAILYSSGDTPTAPWKDVSGVNVITPS